MESEKSKIPRGGESSVYPHINPPPYSESYFMTPPQPTGPPPPLGPPPPTGPPPHNAGPTTVHVAYALPGATVTMVPGMGSGPTRTTCRSCNMEIVSRIERMATTKTHLFALLLCVFGCWPCVCIPYCMDSCRNIDHYCPNCNAYIGSYRN